MNGNEGGRRHWADCAELGNFSEADIAGYFADELIMGLNDSPPFLSMLYDWPNF
ncbi:MAG: hypothetical protein GY927_15240 [bacterium]|nr:hypothetical protein [bacterium]